MENIQYDRTILFSGIICSGVFISFLVSKILQMYPNNKIMKNTDDNTVKLDLFGSDMYNINGYVHDKTSYGDIYMKYDDSMNKFIYWGDNTFPFNVLETMAKKFCLVFDKDYLTVDTKHKESNEGDDDDDHADDDVFIVKKQPSTQMVIKAYSFVRNGSIDDFIHNFTHGYNPEEHDDDESILSYSQFIDSL